MNLISLSEAMKITKHRTEAGFRSYIRRMNMRLPQEKQVILCRAMIDQPSLEIAIRAYHTKAGTK